MAEVITGARLGDEQQRNRREGGQLIPVRPTDWCCFLSIRREKVARPATSYACHS